MGSNKEEEEEALETLASASGKNVETLLNRAKKQKTSSKAPTVPHLPQSLAGILPPPPPRQQPLCGAPAAKKDQQQEDSAIELLDSEEEGPQAADSDWEDIDEHEQDHHHQPTSNSNKTSSPAKKGGITVNLNDATNPSNPENTRRRTSYTKEDRETALLVHRSHLISLLGRGLLYDSAADDPLLQATALSIIPQGIATKFQCGIRSVDEENQQSALTSITEWFRMQFKLVKTSSVQPLATNEDEVDAAIARAKGVDGVRDQLLDVLQLKCGTAEELSTVFAVLLRSLGCLARTVRLLEPSSMKPGDALRQQENAMKAYMKNSSRSGSGRRRNVGDEPISLIGQAAADLLNEKASQQQETMREMIAAQLGLEDSRAIKVVGGGAGRGPAIMLDHSKLRQNKKKKAKLKPAKKKEEKTEEEVDLLLPGEEKEEKEEEEKPKASGSRPSKRNNKRKSPEKEGKPCDDGVLLEDVQEKKNSKSNRKRKGDEEFERELELAMAATAFENNTEAKNKNKPLNNSSPTRNDSSTTKKNGLAGMKRSTGAVFGAHQGHVGKYWIEIYCGSPVSGRWVHVCPISGWIDRERDIEGLAPRSQPIAYVVAFSGGGGAKDVTRRYTSSFITAEKNRDGQWWDATMKPLRNIEVAAIAGNNQIEISTAAAAAAGPSNTSNKKPAKKPPQPNLVALREDKELEIRASSERLGLPTTIDGFKKHTVFILARHIGKHQALKPRSKVQGLHKGEQYYLREDIGDVHTVERWKRLGREVLAEELENPAKKIKKRGTGPSKGKKSPLTMPIDEMEDDEEGAEEELSNFYGIWQTGDWAPPAAVGGKVPKNERGNVEVPPLAAALPQGTVHVRLPAIGVICRKLDIDYAPALTGFDIHGGRSVPSIDGVVICAEHEAALRAAYEEDARIKAELARKKRLAEGEKNWRQLLHAILMRVRVGVDYKANGEQPTAECEAAAMLANDVAAGHLPAGGGGRKRKNSSGGGGEKEEEKDEEPMVADVKVEEI